MGLNIKHHDIKVTIEDGDVSLQQDIGAGENHTVYLSPEQFLMIADRLRGIHRPSPEAEESRKLRVIADRLRDFVLDDGLRKTLFGVDPYRDYLSEIDAIDDLAQEYAYGLMPDTPNQSETPQRPIVQASDALTQQYDLLEKGE